MSNEKTSTNREALLKTAMLVRPAIASANYILALTHIAFDGKYATAYNDISAISVACGLDMGRSVPGELLIRSLSSFGAEQIAFQEGKDGVLTLSSGRGRVKLPSLDLATYPYAIPTPGAQRGSEAVHVDGSILKGIERCLLSVNTDPTQPAQMGVTLDFDKQGNAVLFSTDNFTISRYQTKTEIQLPGDAPIIMPRFFCEQLVSLARAFPDEKITLWLMGGALLAEFGREAKLFSKTPAEIEPLDFPSIVEKHVKLSNLKELMFTIPNAWDSAFQRAMLVLASEDDKATRITLEGDEILLSSGSQLGEADDQIKYDSSKDDPEEPFYVDPTYVIRASKACAMLGFGRRVLIMADSDLRFVHIIAHCAKSKQK